MGVRKAKAQCNKHLNTFVRMAMNMDIEEDTAKVKYTFRQCMTSYIACMMDQHGLKNCRNFFHTYEQREGNWNRKPCLVIEVRVIKENSRQDPQLQTHLAGDKNLLFL